MGFLEFCTIIYTQFDRDDPWYMFYQTRDWYDMPQSIRDNNWLYQNTQAIMQRTAFRGIPRRFYIYPKDVEYIYDCTPEAARSLLNDVRESLELPVSNPVTIEDFQAYTELDLQTIHDFIIES